MRINSHSCPYLGLRDQIQGLWATGSRDPEMARVICVHTATRYRDM